MPRIAQAACVVALLLGMAGALRAQIVNSSVDGVVQDRSGAIVPDAQLTLTNLSTGIERTTLSNADGRYSFPSVPVGTYSLKVSKAGFESYLMSHFTVVVSQRVTTNVVLSVGAVSDSVTVEAGGLTALLEPSSNELGTLIAPAQVEQLSLNGRNYLQLGLLAGATQSPGITPGADFISAQGGHPDRSINVGGNGQDFTSYLD
jgi:hypothetical protein